MNKNSNTYTFLYAAALVAVVATALSLTATGLKSRQQKNIEVEKKENILLSVNKAKAVDSVPDRNGYVEDLYERYIVEAYLVDAGGNRKEGDAFTADMKAMYDIIKKINGGGITDEERAGLRRRLLLPVFVCRNDDGALKYIVPVYGLGLWGAIWGYVSLDDDFDTICGAIFDHKSETPGLGAEIALPKFFNQFAGKQLFENGQFTSIRIVKGGAPAGDRHGVDAISGGTITSRGVEEMLKNCLTEYRPFFEQQKKNAVTHTRPSVRVTPDRV
ncbi:MAG: NADH:ubiquinone reductase (Na(+)-transporting) subunit C [Prevotellaceae bacterium]|jgi:Na+-transporting NADH:ubiquinone oxidoreductase subunit C|nr:NADH:ubiquinone reductase (Na(+)-transporting) subunit C [Prevotellaceae bacterium]